MLELTVRVVLPKGPVLVGLIVAARPLEAETVRNTVLLNAFKPCRLIVDIPGVPTGIVRLAGFAVIVKSEVLERTVTETMAV